jgi:hypothetical protein
MNDLLKAELSTEGSGRSLYSSKALFFTAFFGGPIAVVLLSALNSRLLNRLKSDLIFYFLAGFLIFAFLYYVIVVPENAQGIKWLGEFRRANPVFKYGPRVIALIFWVISYALHRKFHKAIAIMGLKPMKPWVPGIICTIVGGIIQIGLVFSILGIHGVL